MLQIWSTVTNLFILCWGTFLILFPPKDAEKRRYGITLTLCILILIGFFSFIVISNDISQRHEIEIQKRISDFIKEGNQLKENCVTKIERPDLKPLYDDWVKRITEYLLPLNPSYIPRLNMVVIGRGGGIGPKINEDIWNYVNVKNQVLIEIIKEREQYNKGSI